MNTEEALCKYRTGQYTIRQIADEYGVSAGKMYYTLRDNGCEFTRRRRKPFTDAEREMRSKVHKGKVLSEKQRKTISEHNSCEFNGLNGYGHIKRHNGGYILGYAPRHPHAHTDGYVMLHTIIMERHIGRYLNDDEVVHHINHRRDDNRIENLKLMTKKAHMSMHMKERHQRRNDLSIA